MTVVGKLEHGRLQGLGQRRRQDRAVAQRWRQHPPEEVTIGLDIRSRFKYTLRL